MNSIQTTTPAQVVAPVGTTPPIQAQTAQDAQTTYNEGNGIVDTIVMTGPLSEIYTRALGVYFAKKPLETNALATESQAMTMMRNAAISQNTDAGLREIADAVQLQTPAEVMGNVDATVYAVDYSQIDRPEVIDAMQRLRDRSEAAGTDYIIAATVVEPLKEVAPGFGGANTYYEPQDASSPVPDGHDNGFTRATESYSQSLGFPVVVGMEAFAQWVLKRQEGKTRPLKAAQESLAEEKFSVPIVEKFFSMMKRESLATEGFKDWFKKAFGAKAEKVVQNTTAEHETPAQRIENAKSAVGQALSNWKNEDTELSLEVGEAKTFREVISLIDWFITTLGKSDTIVKTNMTNQEKLFKAYLPFVLEGADPVEENKKILSVIKSIHQSQPGLYGMKYKKDGKTESLFGPYDYAKLYTANTNLHDVLSEDEVWTADNEVLDKKEWKASFEPYAWAYSYNDRSIQKTSKISFTGEEHKQFLEKLLELMEAVVKAEDVLSGVNREPSQEMIKAMDEIDNKYGDSLYQLVKAYYRGGMCWGPYTIAEAATRLARHNAKAK